MGLLKKLKKAAQIGVNTVIVYKSRNVRYYNQYSLKYFFKKYGEEKMGPTACGPFACAMVASSLLKRKVTPVDVAEWSCQNGFYEYRHGSLHALIPSYCQKMGLECTDVGDDVDRMETLLRKGDTLAILLCRQGAFSAGRHFVVAGICKDGFKVYNSGNVLDCYRRFDKEKLKRSLAEENIYIGPIWCVSVKGPKVG